MRKDWKNTKLCSKCHSIRYSNAAFLKVRPTNLTWLIMQSLCLRRPLLISLSSRQRNKKLSSATPWKTHSRFQDVWFEQFDWLEYDAQSKRMFCKVCRAAKSKNIFSNEGAGVYIFVVLIAHFPRFVRLKNK